jgi:dienelactone hydrolase
VHWLLACSHGPDADPLPFDPAGPDAAPDPGAVGPYSVGVRTFDAAGLTVEVWYPAGETARGEPGFVYRIEDLLTADAIAAAPDVRDLDVALPTAAVRDARPRGGAFPVVLFSHGAGGLRMQSTYLTVHLASHGHVVAAPDHPGSTLSDLIIAGDVDEGALFASFAARTAELAAVRDALPGELDSADVDRLGVAGHSFGALTAMRWLLIGEDADAVVAQAVPPIELASLGAVLPLSATDAEVQLQVGGLDATTPPEDAEGYWAELGPARGRLDLAHGGHFTFSDMCGLDPETIAAVSVAGIGDAVNDGCADTNTDPAVAIPVIRHFAIAELNAALRDSPGSRRWLSQEEADRLAPGEATWRQ